MAGFQCVLEGSDCSGKTTMCSLLNTYLSKIYSDVRVSRHPGATPLGVKLRELLKAQKFSPNTEALLFAVDNSAYINEMLIPAMDAGAIMIADRNNFTSSMAYQIASGCSMDELKVIHSAITPPPKIDILFIMDIDWDTFLVRSKGRGIVKDSFEKRGKEYFDKVMSAYRSMSTSSNLNKYVNIKKNQSYPVSNTFIIDCRRDIDKVYREIVDILDKELQCEDLQVCRC